MSQRTSAANICQDGRTKLPSRAFLNPTLIRVRARTEMFSGERIFRGGIETREGEPKRTIRVRTQQRKLQGTSIATSGRLTSLMRAYRPFAPISGTRNSRLSGQASGRTRHHRRHPSLVGARRLHSEVGPENCRDRRATRRTRFSRRKIIRRRPGILPRLPELSRDASATATAKLYS